ncbi:hypothetical protein BHE74_00042925 [Ensete ventricosum]|nr:hypothetical protein BHE74_00042925 [Ensete ventricosum]
MVNSQLTSAISPRPYCCDHECPHSLVGSIDLRCFGSDKETGGALEEGRRPSDAETSSKASTSHVETLLSRSNSSLCRGFFRLWKHKSLRRLSSFPPVGFRKWSKKRSNRETHPSRTHSTSTDDFCFFRPTWKNFTISELEKATDNFSPGDAAWKGGYADIFRGRLEYGRLVAVKRISRGSKDERTHNFLCEMGVLVHLHHPNIAKLIGVGVEGGMHLVFELSHHGSLENLLHGTSWTAQPLHYSSSPFLLNHVFSSLWCKIPRTNWTGRCGTRSPLEQQRASSTFTRGVKGASFIATSRSITYCLPKTSNRRY